MQTFKNEIINATGGEARFDVITRRAYSVDASIYEIEPLGIVTPKSRDELIHILKVAHSYGVPVIARGAATGITGGCIGAGLIIDLSKYLNRIIEINYDQEYAICEPGVVQDDLNAQLSKQGYRLGPDTSTGNRATIGGMLANNAAGARSLRYGRMVDHIEEVTLALSDGDLITLKALTNEEVQEKRTLASREGEIYRTVFHLQQEYSNDIRDHFPKIPRRVSGYNLEELIKDEKLNLAKIIAGSEGSLGIVLELKVRISKKPKVTGLCLVHCTEMLPALHHISAMLRLHPLSLEMIDSKILTAGRSHPAMKGKLNWLIGDPEAIFIAEIEGDTEEAVKRKLAAFTVEMQKLNFGYAFMELVDPLVVSTVWEVRKAGLGLLLSKRTYNRAIAFIEDVSVAPEKLASFMEQFLQCLKHFGKEAGIYGHVGAGCMHIRPYVDLNSLAEQQTMEQMMLAVADLLLDHGGALSGEHGDGYVRSWLNEKMFGPRLYKAFCELKSAFDPTNLMNPGKVVHGLPLLHDLRSFTEGTPSPIPTFLDFAPEGGFELAADLCNGNGLCRKGEGVMCPSFQVTRDEYDTTRARAQALRAIIHGHLPKEALHSQEVYDILKLCLQCKGCKSECPSQVDMAKMKSEVLYQNNQKHGYSLRTRLFGYFGKLNRLLSPFSALANAGGRSALGKRILRWLGIAQERNLPPLTKERFSHWAQRQPPTPHLTSKVVLFSDTYTEFNHPEIGIAATKVLHALGYTVIVPPWRCCGRTLFSKGMLPQAKQHALALLDELFNYAEQQLPIIGLEPSCLMMITDDLQNLVGDDERCKKVRSLCTIIDEFLESHLINGKLPLPLSNTETHFMLHVHCHQKSLLGVTAPLKVLNGISGCTAKLIETGCCGMAGSFGYEQENYELSMKIGGLKLFPAILQGATDPYIQFVANGVSCRQQIIDGTKQKVFHLAEVISSRLVEEGSK
jgi:FAD/FMN-containing dehydrogenase/Fe-S oxidoreductase